MSPHGPSATGQVVAVPFMSASYLHTTWLGKKIVDFWWHGLADSSYHAAGVPADSPLRHSVLPFWHTRVNDEGVPRPNGFHALAVAGKVEVICPARVSGYGGDGSVILEDGRSLPASAVILATGYTSSWPAIFDEQTIKDLGSDPQPAKETTTHEWNYTTLAGSPPIHPEAKRWSSSLYRGIVPAKHISRRDLAVNGAVVSPNFGYTTEVTSHWISSYILGDHFLRLPKIPEEAFASTERDAAWLRARYPQIPTALNNSHTSYLAFWSWSQHADDDLEDMGLPIMRSGGNAITWPFKVIYFHSNRSVPKDGNKGHKQLIGATIDFVIGCLRLSIPYMFIGRTYGHSTFDEESGLYSADPMLKIGACACLVTVVILSAMIGDPRQVNMRSVESSPEATRKGVVSPRRVWETLSRGGSW
ncbi:hypothetical protein DICSQDRAFT_169248 [Dichomitus squalens LYAD-421 SS1]|uniref:FAD/NAD(P)-binding domain-containing protein n=1 Tax=Dichomitus squalens (strain LYAD-421) TaxID=732165 RepID=R7T2X5_DICSQ|nr:uncharacterized protein DICSQDRAFT_169248 [Dichomitus squalens LYAD-421 SS1]EJF62217.1 hypothetical protein DICSQDRAFT_169248 [Dichomitus squalens LYAD-421 SS1]